MTVLAMDGTPDLLYDLMMAPARFETGFEKKPRLALHAGKPWRSKINFS